MSKRRFCASIVFAFLLALISSSAFAKRLPDPCQQTRADFARQMQELKRQHAGELAQCQAGCLDLKERQKEEMRQLQERQRLALNGCNRPFLAFEGFENQHYFHQAYYRNSEYYPPEYRKPHRYRDHDGDGDHHHHHHHDGDNDHHHHDPGNNGGGSPHSVAAQPRHDGGPHSAAVSTVAVHQQWVHDLRAASTSLGGGGGGASSSWSGAGGSGSS